MPLMIHFDGLHAYDMDNLSRWTSSNFEELEEILHDLIPHIRWSKISETDFLRKVAPFKKIFLNQLYKDVKPFENTVSSFGRFGRFGGALKRINKVSLLDSINHCYVFYSFNIVLVILRYSELIIFLITFEAESLTIIKFVPFLFFRNLKI
jgi:hypothetical protein